MERICEICKKKFNTSHKKTKFCSRQCYGKYLSERMIGKMSVRKGKQYIGKKTVIKYCLTCNKKIVFRYSSGKVGKFCSRQCWKNYNKKNGWNREREKHWNWKGGISKEYERIRNPIWKITRKKVYKRDNWTCQICKIKCNKYKGQIQCHHIIPYRITQDNSENNLITLCASCHAKEEREYYAHLKANGIQERIKT